MSRLPIVGSDDGTWGTILNDYLEVQHSNATGLEGTHKAITIPALSLATDDAFKAKLTADTQYQFTINADGKLEWGPGGITAPDTNLYRSAADTLKTDDSLVVTGTATASNYKRGTGSPESAVTGVIGDLYLRTDGGAGTVLYVKESGVGNTGWRAVNDAAAALSTHEADTTAVHGITNTAVLAVTNADNNFGASQTVTGTVSATDVKGTLETAAFSYTGTNLVAAGAHRYYVDNAYTIVEVRASVGTAPTGASIIVDVNKNGTTVFTTQANRPTIAASGFTDGSNVPDVTSLADGDYLTVDIDQVGSTIAGADLTVQVLLRRA